MYEYFPKGPKKREFAVLTGLLGGGFFVFGFSKIPNLPFPGMLQLLSVIMMTGAVIVLTRYLLRDFCYRIDLSEGSGAPDFTVTEYCGKRISVVCRISLNDVVEVRPITAKEGRSLAKERKGRRVYDYTCLMDPENLYLLTIRDGEDLYDVRIVADAELCKHLSHQ